ncbi:C40 family peptidase [Arthrobacter sp. M4]|uniref:C40 family peptidase n=1 Tax=Arthrobacter sp. M4 TaxID=218160 RepID=UPI001CDC537F|nr:NlpC/P60 family protein [Arthrobacter sp. M4]MCA4133829.1 C40 family peptidase [Arthrobacter sp. M4]
MSSRSNLARHRADAVSLNPLNTLTKAVATNAGTVGRQAAAVAAASGLLLTAGLPAHADSNVNVSASESGSTQLVVTAEPTATVSFERPAIATKAAPKIEAPKVEARSITAAADEAADAASSAATAGLAAIAYTGIGSPYLWGGTTPAGWDCSGFTQWVYAQAGIKIPRTNAWTIMKPTSTPAPGDLVMQNGGAHVGIYVGNGMMISALNPSQGTILHAVSATGTSSFYTLR